MFSGYAKYVKWMVEFKWERMQKKLAIVAMFIMIQFVSYRENSLFALRNEGGVCSVGTESLFL